MNTQCLIVRNIQTALGPMVAVAEEKGICLLEFSDRRMLQTELAFLRKHYQSSIIDGNNHYLEQLNSELDEYFAGGRKTFDIPLVTPGTVFQQQVWNILQEIPYGKTRSYKEQALAFGNLKAIRAVAGANGANRIAIVIPCHRVIGDNGQMTGYGGKIWRKRWLIEHEQKNRTDTPGTLQLSLMENDMFRLLRKAILNKI